MKIVFLDEYSIGEASLKAIESLGDYIGYEFTTGTEQTIKRCKGADVVITNKVVMSREVISKLPDLRLICVAATGVNNIDLNAAEEFRVAVRNAVGYSTASVAEATFTAALALNREVSYYDRFVKSAQYSASERLFCHDRRIGELCGQNWGIIGLGAIGRRVAELAKAFGCKVRYYSTSGATRKESVERAETLRELLEWSDVISLHAPLNEKTAGLIGEKELSLMRPNAILVNVARGGIVDEAALVTAINSGTIRAAALDVFGHEPLEKDSALLKINDPNRLLLSPHNAWQSAASVDRLVAAIAENIMHFFE